jgi:hypothetical protein
MDPRYLNLLTALICPVSVTIPAPGSSVKYSVFPKFICNTYMGIENHRGMILTGETEELGENARPRATLSNIKSKLTNTGANPGLRVESKRVYTYFLIFLC